MSRTTSPYDIAVVGLGPVGQTLALLLAQGGHKVVVVERQAEPYHLPRAVHYDPDISRLLDRLGMARFMADFACPSDTYEWQNAARQTLIRFEFAPAGDQGWPDSTMFTQPALERALMSRGRQFDDITVLRGHTATALSQDEDGVTLTTLDHEGHSTTVRAGYLVGADGANSFVRGCMDTDVEDLGFFHRWLVVDIVPRHELDLGPDNLQLCDPARPTTSVNSGPGRRRFEFMLMPGEDAGSFDTEANAWALMVPWGVGPDNADIERRALYTFQAKWATRWRDRRVFLAGDAAHQMPPFFGQGMVSGMRDSANLGWKLDLVLSGLAGESLLDSYESERSAHVQHAIHMSLELGRVICQTDPAAVAQRDAHFLAKGPRPEDALPPVPPERLGSGAFDIADPAGSPVAGLISVQGRVGYGAGVDLLDRVASDPDSSTRTVVVCDGTRVRARDADRAAAALPGGLGARLVRVLPVTTTETLGPDGPGPAAVLTVTDEDDRYLPWLHRLGLSAVAIRPDFYAFGAAADSTDLTRLVSALGPAYRLTT